MTGKPFTNSLNLYLIISKTQHNFHGSLQQAKQIEEGFKTILIPCFQIYFLTLYLYYWNRLLLIYSNTDVKGHYLQERFSD